MTLKKNVKIQIFTVLSLLCMAFFVSSSFAALGVKITAPPNGSTVSPGQQVTVKIEAVGGFKIKQGIASILI